MAIARSSDALSLLRPFIIESSVSLTVDAVLYGIYAILYILCISVLIKHRSKSHLRFHLITVTILFGLATAGIVLDILNKINVILLNLGMKGLTSQPFKFGLGTSTTIVFIFALANSTADAVLVFRLYIIWGSRKSVVFVPAIIAILDNCAFVSAMILAIVGTYQNREDLIFIAANLENAFLLANAGINALFTLLIAGRIYWIRREVRALIGHESVKQNYRAIAIICIESGVLYPLALLTFFLVANLHKKGPFPSLIGFLIQAVGISPTLIIVRAGMGVSTDSVDSTIATLQPYLASNGPDPPRGPGNQWKRVQAPQWDDLESFAAASPRDLISNRGSGSVMNGRSMIDVISVGERKFERGSGVKYTLFD
ncbi:hypothetical protein K435DRAFT_967402 [Dendrothele bispora CBS 962.96]|uniref:Uncharacterized protein n=1 Tax=Dendrothele bispora (strain CBS 962.96) TaxID=1314807 RepID=A0A4S8LUJ2_DENBC|nr:hypothetical protein K435DRAFT_967402 [Dendrothele bispora CBS 962.96]